jgi:PadR family transcriptional regulator, regulatory protein PadR
MDRELKRGTLEMVLLRLLAERDRYGYELTAEMAERSEGTFELKEGTLYPVLYRLENAGLVEPYWETQSRGVPRKYYRITKEGREELNRQLREWQAFLNTMQALLAPEAEDEHHRAVRGGG